MAIVTPDQGSIDLGRSRINNVDTYARPMGETGSSGFEELSKAMSRLGITLEDRAGKEKAEQDRGDQDKIPYYVNQFATELDTGVVDEVQVGKRMPQASQVIVSKVVQGVGQRQYEDYARQRMEVALREDASLRTDPSKRKDFFDTLRNEVKEQTRGRAFYGAGASRGLEGVINEFESGFQREGADQYRKNEEAELGKRVGSALRYPKAGATAGDNGSLLDFIAERAESGGNYNAYYGNAKNNTIRFTEMTVGEVLEWQKSTIRSGGQSAVGRYQIINETFLGIVKEMGIDRNAKFDQNLQDAMGVHLLKRRGVEDYNAGKITKEQFANNLAMEWAGLPVVSGAKAGRSFYDDDGRNKSQVGVSAFLAAIDVKGPSANPVSAIDKEPSGLSGPRRREIVVASAIDTATSSLDPAVLDRIPKELRGVPDVEQKIEVARKYILDRAKAESDRADTLRNRQRAEDKRGAEQLFNSLFLSGKEPTSEMLDMANRVSPDIVEGLAARKQQIANLRPQEESRKFDEVRTEMRRAIAENKDPRLVSAWKIVDPKLQQQARAYSDDLAKTGGAITDDYYTKRWSEDSKNMYKYLFGNPSIDMKTDPNARDRQNTFEFLLSDALIAYVKREGDTPFTPTQKAQVYNEAISALMSVWPPQTEQANNLLSGSSPNGPSVGMGSNALTPDAKRMLEMGKKLYK